MLIIGQKGWICYSW